MDLLRQRASTAVRCLLFELLDTAAQCADRLTDRDDQDALHDFRVALRRLNTNQRAYQASLGVKLGKGVRRLARATNAARDCEVQLDWLRVQRQHSKASGREHLDALLSKQEQALAAERERAYPQWQAEFARQANKLRRRLATMPNDEAVSECFAMLAGAQLQALDARLRNGFAAIAAQADDAVVHATRIVGKRLRYLLEPLVGAVPGVPALIKRLKSLQDLLGEIHDCQVRLDDFAGRGQAEHAAQYAALQRETGTRRAHLLGQLERRWLGEHADVLFTSLAHVIERLNKAGRAGGE